MYGLFIFWSKILFTTRKVGNEVFFPISWKLLYDPLDFFMTLW